MAKAKFGTTTIKTTGSASSPHQIANIFVSTPFGIHSLGLNKCQIETLIFIILTIIKTDGL